MRFSPGDSFDRYAIEALLGEGGMGEVYRAEDTRLGRKVALKVLRAQDLADGETWGRAVARMQREARAVAALSHPSIVAVYDVGEHEGTPFIAMELAQGKPLRELVGKDLPLSTRLGILIDIAKALSAAHHAGLVHRDVKPENVMVQDNVLVKVLDFGIARRAPQVFDPHAPTQDGALVTMTAEGAILGTPAYMPPEQLRGETIDFRADQFAFGVLAFELLSGKLPFRTDKGAVSLIASILSDPAPPLEGVPEDLAEIIARTLEKAPEDRFDSMDDVVSALSSLVSGEAHRTAMKAPPSRRERSVAVTGPEDSKAAPPRRRSNLLPFVVAPLVLLAVVPLGLFFSKKHSSNGDASAASASASAAPAVVATAVTDLPIPASDSAEAKLAFREGLQAIRDATWEAAIAAFDRARKADPGMAAAHLRFSFLIYDNDISTAREAFRKATGLRSSLSERDRGLLDALEPLIQDDPRDLAGSERKLAAVSARYPGDAELVFWHARVALHTSARSSSAEAALALTNRCLELDPQYADCWQTKEMALVSLGRREEALVALEKCAEVAAGAVDCLMDKARIEFELGRCTAVVQTAQRWIAKDPGAAGAYLELAAALYHEHEPASAIRLALDQAEKRQRDAKRPFGVDEVEIFRAVAFGDMAGLVRATEKALSEAPQAEHEAQVAVLRVVAFDEMGKYEDSARAADEYISKSVVHADLRAVTRSVLLRMYAAKLRVGETSRADYEAMRADWVSKQDLSSTERRIRVFLGAYAQPAHSRAMAEEALEKARELLPATALDAREADFKVAMQLGRLMLLAGKPEEARPYLERGVLGCQQFKEMLMYIRTLANLGIAREATGDTKGACEAYRRVLAYWGDAKDSLTAKDLEKRAKALSCEPVRAL